MAKYKVITPVEHDGDRYEPESEIDLSDSFATPLLDVGAIVKPAKKTAKTDVADAVDGAEEGAAK